MWLVKTEEDLYPISQLKKDKVTQWTDVRNYEARNLLVSMKRGDEVLIYHSNATPSGIVGLGVVFKEAYPDPHQFDSKSEYFDPKATADKPRWFGPEIKFSEMFKEKLTLEELKAVKGLQDMALLKRSRLSVQPVKKSEFKLILQLAKQ